MKILATTLLALLTFYCSNAQHYPTLEKALSKALPENSSQDGRWVFYPDKANIERINKPIIETVASGYVCYKVTLTNYLGYHVNQGTCVVLFDSANSKTVLVEPLWYGGISKPLVSLFLKKRFESEESLLSFLRELHEIMEIGSGYTFVRTSVSNELIKYDLVYQKGDSYTTGGNGVSSTINYNQDGVWRKIEVDVKKLQLKRYTSINPAANESETIK